MLGELNAFSVNYANSRIRNYRYFRRRWLFSFWEWKVARVNRTNLIVNRVGLLR